MFTRGIIEGRETRRGEGEGERLGVSEVVRE